MIAGIFHQGSGLGNQLFRYVATRVLALDKGYEWGMINRYAFKGESFMTLDKGKVITDHSPTILLFNKFNEKKVVENGVDIRGYDPEINFVEDNTIIDGEFQDERYFIHHLDKIRWWLKIENVYTTNLSTGPKEFILRKEWPDDLCVIGFRGGEYTVFPDLFLPKEYWDKAIALKRTQNPAMRFEVHTDDPVTARAFFPDFSIIHDIELNWRAVRYAKHLIIANSSFYILPSLLNEDVKEVIAPRYWARHNTKVWALPQNYYKQFTYL